MPPFLRCIAAGLALSIAVSLVGIACTHNTLPTEIDTCVSSVMWRTSRTVFYVVQPAAMPVVRALRPVLGGLLP